MKKYIELNRSFALIPKDFKFDEEAQEFAFSFGFGDWSEKQKWDQLLQNPRVILLAEAGAGKTWEVGEVTKRLRNEGKNAFFFRLEHLGFKFSISFEIGNETEFDQWLKLDELGWFFLDSVDEARLLGPKNFEAAIRNFGDRLGDGKQRAHIFITSRQSEWHHQSDLALVKERLPFIEPVSASEEDSEDPPLHFDKASSGEIKSTKRVNPPPLEPLVFSLLGLDQDQIRTFSTANGVQQVDAFMDAIDKAEADIFCARPFDLLDLIDYWKRHGKIANRAELFELNTTSRLTESDPDHEQVLPLTAEDAQWGAEILAAAVTFQKKSRILIPDKNIDIAIRSEAIDVPNVITNWDTNDIRALLQRPIFDSAIYGTVRFHHRNVREFLTAKWLNRLLKQGKARRAIEYLFFRTMYGLEVLVPSRRPILAWLILFDNRIQDKAAVLAPEVFIQGGDSSSLPAELRGDLLEQFCMAYADQSRIDLSFSLSEIKRFAQPDLDDLVNALLNKHSKHKDIRELLLEMVWQGNLKGCSERALAFAIDKDVDIYTRVYGIRALATVGSDSQKELLVKSLHADQTLKDELILGELIDNYAPEKLTIDDVLSLIERIEWHEPTTHFSINESLKKVCLKQYENKEIIKWIRGFLPLIKQPPIFEKNIFKVSEKYGWLLSISSFLAERLINMRHPDALDKHVLEVIRLSQIEQFYSYLNLEDNSFTELVPKWPELNRDLFWFDVVETRKVRTEMNGKRLTGWRQVGFLSHFWRFTTDDYETVIEDISLRPDMDDRLVALSLAFQLYKDGGRGRLRLNKLKKAVAGVSKLEETLHGFLHPPKMSEEDKRFKRQEAEFKRNHEKRKRIIENEKQKSVEWLQVNYQVLRDTSRAAEDNIWNATHYLINVLRHKYKDRSMWAVANWKDLVPEFGSEVAEAFRDGCMDYWRKYSPKIRSEGIENPNSTLVAVIVGLSGLAMEAADKPDWAKNLTEQEAKLACRYAMHELNGFPNWLRDLHSIYPKTVEERILSEIEWEFFKYDGEERCHYVLNDVFYQLDWIKPSIADRILSFLGQYEPKHDNTVEEALDIVLSCPNCDQRVFIDIAKTKAEELPCGNRQALWLANWMCVNAKGALQTLENILNQITDPSQATEFALNFLVALVSNGRDSQNTKYQDFIKPEILGTLIKLMHKYIRPEEDIVKTSGLRDLAQRSRSRLFDLLFNIPGKPTYLAIMNLAEHHPVEFMRTRYLDYAKRRAEADTEPEGEAWNSGDIAQFAEEAEKVPKNHKELFELTVSRLLDLKAELEEGDTSLAGILIQIKEEMEHRNYIADWLRSRSTGKYNIAPEEELANGKQTDIRIHGLGIDGPVPIEIKIAQNWSGPDLFERLQNQLCGDYLRDTHSNNGIFTLVYRGSGRRNNWEHPRTKKMMDFLTLVQSLKDEAKNIVTGSSKIEDIEIIDIDLTKRNR